MTINEEDLPWDTPCEQGRETETERKSWLMTVESGNDYLPRLHYTSNYRQ